MKIIKITWNDIYTVSGNISLKNSKKIQPLKVETVGFQVFRKDGIICLAKDYNTKTKLFRHISYTPEEMIHKIEILKETK